MLSPLLILLTCLCCSTPLISQRCVTQKNKSDTSETVILDDYGSTFDTKRIWLNITNSKYKESNSTLIVEYKLNEVSTNTYFETLNSLKNYNDGIFYFADLPLKHNGIRVLSKDNNGNVIAQTKWKFDFSTSRLLEIYGKSDIIRQRDADVFHPDAIILGQVLSTFSSFDISYDNGYSAYSTLKYSWINQYAGAVRGDLKNTLFYDYTEEEYKTKSIDVKKTRLISVEEKINELKAKYTDGPIEIGKNVTKIKIIGLFLFVGVVLVSVLISLFFVKKNSGIKNGKEQINI